MELSNRPKTSKYRSASIGGGSLRRNNTIVRKTLAEQEETLLKRFPSDDVETGKMSPGTNRLSMTMIGESDNSESESGSSGKYLVEERGKGGTKNLAVLSKGRGKKPRGLKKGAGKMGKRMGKAALD